MKIQHLRHSISLKSAESVGVENPGKNWSLCICSETEAWIKAASLWNRRLFYLDMWYLHTHPRSPSPGQRAPFSPCKLSTALENSPGQRIFFDVYTPKKLSKISITYPPDLNFFLENLIFKSDFLTPFHTIDIKHQAKIWEGRFISLSVALSLTLGEKKSLNNLWLLPCYCVTHYLIIGQV